MQRHAPGKLLDSGERLTSYYTGRDGRATWRTDMAPSVADALGIDARAMPKDEDLTRLFAGSDRGGQRAAAMYSLIVTAKLNDIDPQAWLADVLARIAAHPAHQLDDLYPWNWTPKASAMAAAAA